MIKKNILIMTITTIFILSISMSSATAPEFEPQLFYTTDEMIDWINSESFSVYQKGRFRNGLVELKRNGQVLVSPNKDLCSAKRRFIEILENGCMSYYHYENKGKGDLILFHIKLIEKNKYLLEKNLIDYFVSLDENFTYNGAQIIETTVENEDIRCVLFSNVEKESTMVGFIKGDYHVLFVFPTGRVNFDYINQLELELVRLNAVDETYTDVSKEDWFYQSVETVRINEYIPGTSKTTFSPNTPADRVTIASALYNADHANGERPFVYTTKFVDVDENDPYATAIWWAQSNGIVNGVGDNKFNPYGYVTRQDFAVMLHRYMKYCKFELPPIEDAKVFADDGEIADYAREAVKTLNVLGIMNGKGNDIIDPRGNVTRAEAAAMLHRMMNKMK